MGYRSSSILVRIEMWDEKIFLPNSITFSNKYDSFCNDVIFCLAWEYTTIGEMGQMK